MSGGASAAGLAAQAIAKQRGVTTLVTGGYASNFVADQSSLYGAQCAPSTDALANAVAKDPVDAGGEKWCFITADYVFGKALFAHASKAVAWSIMSGCGSRIRLGSSRSRNATRCATASPPARPSPPRRRHRYDTDAGDLSIHFPRLGFDVVAA